MGPDDAADRLRLPASTTVVEVGMRDGLQSVSRTLPTPDKLRLVESLIDAGVTEIEVTSFVHPDVLPQMADAEELLARVPRPDGVRYRGLVPNAYGARRAVETGIDEIVVLTCTDPDVLRINQRRTPQQMWAELDEAIAIADDAGVDVTVAVVMAFFAYGSGVVSDDRLDAFVDRIVQAGVGSLYVADSAGMGDPRQIHDAIRRTRRRHPDLRLGVHIHTRAGFALANNLAAILAGVDWVEGAFCGIGGDLWLPGDLDILGNTPTEDLLAMLQYMGVGTGVDLDRYQQVATLAEELTGRRTVGHLSRGGSRAEMAAIDWDEVLDVTRSPNVHAGLEGP